MKTKTNFQDMLVLLIAFDKEFYNFNVLDQLYVHHVYHEPRRLTWREWALL